MGFLTSVALDVGGTYIKSALMDSKGVLSDTFKTPVDSRGDAETIISSISEAVLKPLHGKSEPISGIGIAIPGPFDFHLGISHMKHKFMSLREIKLAPAIIKRTCLVPPPAISFMHDVHAFLQGEAWCGAAQGGDRVMAITLGTGLGAGFMKSGQIVDNGCGSPLYSLWKLPYGAGVLEDRVSRRGIITRYIELTGGIPTKFDVKEIALAGRSGDMAARQVFEELGMILAKGIEPVIADFRPERIVVGGQIANAFDLFAPALKNGLQMVKSLRDICQARHIDAAALYGAAWKLSN